MNDQLAMQRKMMWQQAKGVLRAIEEAQTPRMDHNGNPESLWRFSEALDKFIKRVEGNGLIERTHPEKPKRKLDPHGDPIAVLP